MFLIAGYTVDMLPQGKNMVDSAKAAGLRHIVHVGTFHQPGHPMSRYVGHDDVHTVTEVKSSGLREFIRRNQDVLAGRLENH